MASLLAPSPTIDLAIRRGAIARVRPTARLTSPVAVTGALDEAHAALATGDLSHLDDFVAWLNDVRCALPSDEWRTVVADVIRPHPVTALVHEEPFARRAFVKPRGYAGDAPMLDLVYGEGSPPTDLSPLGQRLHMWSVRQPACRSVRFRCDLLAEMLDETANLADAPRVLSLACGHLREAARSYAMRCNAISELVAVDQDEESLAEVRRSFARFRVTTMPGSVRQMLTGAAKVGEFDFVYSAGLYDYLATTVAGALTRALFRALRPGGRLLVANFAPSLRDIGYMEAMMDWHLVYRDEQAMRQLATAVPASEVASVHTFRDELGNVVYLELRRT